MPETIQVTVICDFCGGTFGNHADCPERKAAQEKANRLRRYRDSQIWNFYNSKDYKWTAEDADFARRLAIAEAARGNDTAVRRAIESAANAEAELLAMWRAFEAGLDAKVKEYGDKLGAA